MASIELVERPKPTIPSFAHLHLHTTYSLLDGAQRIGDVKNPKKEYGLLNKVQELGMSAVAITDHGNMFGAVDFYKKARSAGVKPILGCEVYMAPGHRSDREARSLDGKRAFHLVLLAQNMTGYRNLCKMVSRGFFEGFYYNPRIDKELLRKYSDGIIAFSGCLASEISQHCIHERYDEARAVAKEFQEMLDGRFYMEIQKNGIDVQDRINPFLAEIGRDLQIPLVATNDVHYMTREDAEAQDVLMAIQMKKTVDDPKRLKHEVTEFFLKSPELMYESFKDFPGACENTMKIADMCNVELPIGQHFFPVIASSDESIDNATFLANQCREGLEKRWEVARESIDEEKWEEVRKEYDERLDYELKIIEQMGFSDYFLIVADFINWAKDHGIPVGPGRGSAAGSLVAYAIRITDVDPIAHDLLFERFLNPERISMPDIDVDFCEARREEVIEYVRQRYAVEDGFAVSQIITFGTLKAKAAVKDVARAYGMTYSDADRIAKLIPNELGIKLHDAIQKEPRLAGLIKQDKAVAKVMDISQRLEGLNRHASIHAAGVVISDGRPLDHHVPLYRGANDEVVTQFDMNGVESIGLIKFDFLGLKNLTLIEHCLRLIKENFDVDIDIARIPFDDEETFKLLCRGDTLGVFQLESSGMREVMMNLKPSVFDDVIALVALYRPGPLKGGVVDSFINRKHGREEIKYIFDELEPILNTTYGVCIYQEQVMQIANVVANYSLGEADKLRRAMGKKKLDEMQRQRIRFLDGAKENKFDADKADDLFSTLEKFAEYGFNKSHSAAYGLIAYQTGWLKANYRHEYMAALLTADSGNSEKVLLYLNDCRNSGIEVLPPHVNESKDSFSVVNKKIRFGLAAVKGIGEGPIAGIIEQRDEGPYASFVDFCERMDFKGKRINRRVMEALIKCGAFDGLGPNRASMFEKLELCMQHGQRVQDEKASAQFSLFGGGGMVDAAPPFAVPEIPEWGEKERLSNEKGVLGLYISGHPLNRYHSDLDRLVSAHIAELKEKPTGTSVSIAGIINSRRDMITKRGDRMAFIVIEDLTGEIEVSFFPKTFAKAVDILDAEIPMVIRGDIEKTENSVRFTAKEVFSLAAIRAERAKEIHLDLSMAELTERCVADLASTIRQHHGKCSTFLHLNKPGRSKSLLKLPEEYNLMPSEELVEALERLFGKNPTTFK